jgi:hypothetical protein
MPRLRNQDDEDAAQERVTLEGAVVSMAAPISPSAMKRPGGSPMTQA